MNEPVSILFVGDVVGGLGQRTLLALLPSLRERYAPDFVVVNGENIAGGVGITPKIADQLFAAGVDVITLGNHTYRQREIYALPRRAATDPAPGQLPAQPARPRLVRGRRAAASGSGVVSLSGNLFMDAGPARRSPRPTRRCTRCATRSTTCSSTCTPRRPARRSAMGWYLDGRVTAVVGTHTHVPTADARVLPGGTAYITDVGMTGPRGGVIGVRREQAIEAMATRMPVRFETSTRIRG